MAKANPVHHHETNSVALSSNLDLARGGVEYKLREMIMICGSFLLRALSLSLFLFRAAADAHQPPKRGER